MWGAFWPAQFAVQSNYKQATTAGKRQDLTPYVVKRTPNTVLIDPICKNEQANLTASECSLWASLVDTLVATALERY